MQLTHAEISDFQSVRESNPIDIGDITCLVGSNEAGKTALLKALYRLNPIVDSDAQYSVDDDYPRADVDDYEHLVAQGSQPPATVVRAMFALQDDDLTDLHRDFGEAALRLRHIVLWKGYDNQRKFRLQTDERAAVAHMLTAPDLDADVRAALAGSETFADILERAATVSTTPAVERVTALARSACDLGLDRLLYHSYLLPRLPRLVYFDDLYQLQGRENLDALKRRRDAQQLLPSDHAMLGLIEQARLDIDQLLHPGRTQALVSKLENAGMRLSDAVSRYWSQSRSLRVRFDVRPAHPDDPEGLREGTNIWAWVYDTRHKVTTGLHERSRGFLWFFSFMAWYWQLRQSEQPLVLLLDEPGLSLHAQAQRDLVRYFEDELRPNHQLVYTTHSPFMVNPLHLERVRIVEDLHDPRNDDVDGGSSGTRVLSEFMDARRESLVPLQAALGHRIVDSLLPRSDILVVDDVSDLIYLKVMSELIQQERRIGLSLRWCLLPVGGARRLLEFAALTGTRENGVLAALLGIHADERQLVDAVYARKLLQKNHIVTFGDFLGRAEADIEDMFEPSFYVQLVNLAYRQSLSESVTETALDPRESCMRARVRRFFEQYPLRDGEPFDHYRPARTLLENINGLSADIAHVTREKFATMFLWLNSLLSPETHRR